MQMNARQMEIAERTFYGNPVLLQRVVIRSPRNEVNLLARGCEPGAEISTDGARRHVRNSRQFNFPTFQRVSTFEWSLTQRAGFELGDFFQKGQVGDDTGPDALGASNFEPPAMELNQRLGNFIFRHANSSVGDGN